MGTRCFQTAASREKAGRRPPPAALCCPPRRRSRSSSGPRPPAAPRECWECESGRGERASERAERPGGERASRDCGGCRPLGRQPRPAPRRAPALRAAPSLLARLLLLSLLLARAPAPAAAPPGRPGPGRREVVKIHVGRPRGEHRKGEASTPGPGARDARHPPGVRIPASLVPVPLTCGELQCVTGGSRGVNQTLPLGLSGEEEKDGAA